MNKTCIKSFLRVITGLIITASVIVSCKTTQTAADLKDLSYLYNPTKNLVNPHYNVTNQSDDRSVLEVKFSGNELFFSEANPRGIPIAEMLVTVKLFSLSQGRVLADTAHVNLSIEKEKGKQEYIYEIPLKVSKGSEYIAEVKILDRLRLLVMQAFVPFNTLSKNNRYNFLAREYFQRNELFDPIVRRNEFVNLVYLRGKPDSIYISYYKPFRLIPDPPAMLLPEKTIDYGPDTTVALSYSDTLPMMFPKEGIYMCKIGRDTAEGYAFMNFGPSYPVMNTPEAMIEPLAYLATPDELDQMRSATRPKVALDEFWIKCAKNVDKARELIRIYYTRVEYADFYFTSYKEGWRTERGMIYLIYGPPDKVYKNSEGESWGYRKPIVKSSWGTRYTVKEEYLYFNFKKKESIFTNNDYYLSRSETLVSFWDQAIACWKKGIVFRLDNPEEF
ncbi:MAG: GWxTD domain-containing protein [Bacteroidales bacterium]